MKRWVALGLLSFAMTASAAPSVTRHVDPFIGTDGTGHVTPAAAVPFGMVMPGPDNAGGGWSYSSGYQYRAPKILGFSNTHISGAGIPELGDVLLQPSSGQRWNAATTDFASGYVKASEVARPGYYTVGLREHGVKVELAAMQRVALHRYTFERPGRVQVLVDLQHGLVYGEAPRVIRADTAVDGAEAHGTVHTRGWVEREASFVLRFDRAPLRVTTLPARAGEQAPRWLLDFDLGAGRVLEARIALSTIDVAGARRNLADAQGKTFDAVRAEADAAWNALLGRVRIDADARTKRIFYSALYRTLLHPSDIADADGRVRGPRGEVMQVPGGRYYSTLSLWDTFRAVHPLHTLLVPERVDGYVQTLIAHQRQQGYLPLWTAWGRETHTMIGNPALPVIADAVAKGFKGFDGRDALRAMVETSTHPRPGAPEWAQREWATLDRYGYLPFDIQKGEAVSMTLEHGYGDDAVARVARALGDTATAERFAQRAQSYRALFDRETQTMRGRDSTGRWREPFDPLVPTSPLNNPGDYTEANAWQYTATPALHDPLGFRELLGGPKMLEAWLDRFFTTQVPNPDKHLGQEALIGQYAHGNEPSHHVAWLYAYTDAPRKGHALVRRIVSDFYGDKPNGIIGNDDCGQMSAWLVFAMLGFYPVQPASGQFVLGAPLVRAASLQLPGRAVLRITASRGQAAGARLDGRAVDPLALRYADLMAGGTLARSP
jgi:predicted alpha-1,2-mannosidase